jgi:hypothetical protein
MLQGHCFYKVYEFARVAVTEQYRLGGLYDRNVSLFWMQVLVGFPLGAEGSICSGALPLGCR